MPVTWYTCVIICTLLRMSVQTAVRPTVYVFEYTPINVQAVVILYDNMQNLQSKAIVRGASVVLYFLYCLHIGRGERTYDLLFVINSNKMTL